MTGLGGGNSRNVQTAIAPDITSVQGCPETFMANEFFRNEVEMPFVQRNDVIQTLPAHASGAAALIGAFGVGAFGVG